MIEYLKSILKQPDTVIFIGSGVSLWSGLPSWIGLITELSTFLKIKGYDSSLVDQELIRGDLLQAASYGFDKLTKQQIAEFIRSSCRLGKTKPHDIHEKIIKLGPTCFVTTNYDKLLELSFQKWSEDFYRTVINRQLTETAEIVGARSTNFLFKLHGDTEDSESIILTREQYRNLNPGGELNHALEAVKTLMVSRPFIYLGFGLKDPDFLYVKDLLFNTFKGGTRDHCAIMADISEPEKDYWKRNFGIHLVTYETIKKEDGSRDHSPLLDLLDELLKEQSKPDVELIKLEDFTLSPEFVLSLARHASKYSREKKSLTHIPLLVDLENKTKKRNNSSQYQFSGESVEFILDKGPEKFILIGLPGSGKSYSLKLSAARFADKLYKDCLEESFDPASAIIPIFGDLKLYNGNLYSLLESTLPTGMKLDFLISKFKVKIYLDAFNEMPREYIETNAWDKDFSGFLDKASNTSIIITSRTSDGLEKLNIPIFGLNSIEEEFIKLFLINKGIELMGSFKEDILFILQRPFFYRLLSTTDIRIDSETSPHRIYEELLSLTEFNFKKRFQTNISLMPTLAQVAIEAIDNGEEAFKIDKLKSLINIEIENNEVTDLTSHEIINWLVSQEFLIPLINERICFFHQSITEFLAAQKLAQLSNKQPEILKEKLSFRRWDQALFLTLSLLNQEKAKEFLEEVISIDFHLALIAVKFMEYNNTEVIERLLLEIPSRITKDRNLIYSLDYILETKLPVTIYHIPTLKTLIDLGDTIGGTAISLILKINGKDFIPEAFEFLVKCCDDYNFCSRVGKRLRSFDIIDNNLPLLLTLTDQVQDRVNAKEIEEYAGFDSALGGLLNPVDPELVFETFFDPQLPIEDQAVRLAVICDFLQDTKSIKALKVAFKLLDYGVPGSIFTIHMIAKFSKIKQQFDWSIVEERHVKRLIQYLKNKNKFSGWALNSLQDIISKRKDFTSLIIQESKECSITIKAALLYCIYESENNYVFDALKDICKLSNEQLAHEDFSLLSHIDLTWEKHEKLLVDLLKVRDIKLATNLCDPIALDHSDNQNLILEIDPIHWWLEWFLDSKKFGVDGWMFRDRVSSVITKCVSRETRKKFISEFNDANSQYRDVLSQNILKILDELSLKELNEDTILYLINELNEKDLANWNSYSLLTKVSTETFVNDRLLPMLDDAKGKFHANLLNVLDSIGHKHGRRYIIN